jgi:hypothetical protein
MHTASIRSPRSLATFKYRTLSHWRSRLHSILSTLLRRQNEERTHDIFHRLDDQLLAEVGLYREHRIHHAQSRTDRQREAPVPVALLAMWMPRI